MNDSTEANTPISTWAFVSLFASLLSYFSYLAPLFITCAIVGILAGGYSLQQIRRYGHLGYRCAIFGCITSMIVVTTAPVWQLWQYRIESPVGYLRLNFGQLTKSIDPALDAYLGEKIFLKGYAYPQRDLIVDQFVLMSTGDPDNRDAMLLVKLNSAAEVGYHDQAIAVSGILERNPTAKKDDKQPKYMLRESSVLPNRTRYDWSPRTHSIGGC